MDRDRPASFGLLMVQEGVAKQATYWELSRNSLTPTGRGRGI